MTKLERILITKTPLAFLLKKSKQIVLPGFQGIPLYDVLRFFYLQIKAHGMTERASAISYNFIMAIPPSLLFLFTLIPNLPFVSKRVIRQQLHALITDIVPSKAYNKDVIKFIDSFLYDNRVALLSFGLLLSLFFASSAMMGLIRSFNKKHYVGIQKKMGLMLRLNAIKLTVIIFGLFLGCFILLVSQGALLKWLIKDRAWRELFSYTRWIFIVLLIFYAIGFIFRYAPSFEKKWKLNSPGTIVTTFLILLSSYSFSVFVDNFGRYNVLYGSIGTIMMIMALIYINSLAIIIGFELNVSINSIQMISKNRIAAEKKQLEKEISEGSD